MSTDQPDPEWRKTNYSNLVRYVPSGTYFARVRVKGKLIRRSLKTDVLSVAKLRLDDLQKKERTNAEKEDRLECGKLTFGEAVELVKSSIDANPELKQRTKDYYAERLKQLWKTWPGLKKMPLRSISQRECETGAEKFSQENSANSYNHTVALMRWSFKRGIKMGACYVNPAAELKYAKVKRKKLRLPETDQFQRIISHISKARNGFDKPSADLVRFLAYGGFRITEAKNISWADCDFTRSQILVKGHIVTGTKNSNERLVPMIPEMKKLLFELRMERKDEQVTEHVMTVGDCRKALASACKSVSIPKITHHDLRHLFATTCIESGVDIPTVSRWLGHKDGGALAMKTYGHLRDEHSASMAKKVTFSPSATEPKPGNLTQTSPTKESPKSELPSATPLPPPTALISNP